MLKLKLLFKKLLYYDIFFIKKLKLNYKGIINLFKNIFIIFTTYQIILLVFKLILSCNYLILIRFTLIMFKHSSPIKPFWVLSSFSNEFLNLFRNSHYSSESWTIRVFTNTLNKFLNTLDKNIIHSELLMMATPLNSLDFLYTGFISHHGTVYLVAKSDYKKLVDLSHMGLRSFCFDFYVHFSDLFPKYHREMLENMHLREEARGIRVDGKPHWDEFHKYVNRHFHQYK